MKRHKHYQAIRAFADGWRIEESDNNVNWHSRAVPEFYTHRFYRIVPDSEGWLPWYATKDSKCPVDEGQMVEVWLSHRNEHSTGIAGNFNWGSGTLTTSYRLVKEVDPFSELKAAYEAGETIQVKHPYFGWLDLPDPKWDHSNIDLYRIKPKTKKMWQWVIQEKDNLLPELSAYFYTKEDIKAEAEELGFEIIQRADWTEIEVEVNEH